MRKWILFPLLLFYSSYLPAQKQNYIWYFGANSGIDFNITPPKALSDGAMYSSEGCATICNENGQLLFYTNGVTVYNKNHQIMEHGTGLLGHSSATQSAIIVPWPGSNNLYYIITSDAFENQDKNGYNYSIVDLSKNNGLGEVIIKNQLLYKSSTEKLTVALHCNGKDWWIITKQFGNNIFYCYLVDHNGLLTTPVISTTGLSLTTDRHQEIGGLTVSPDGKKLAMMVESNTFRSQVYDFDNATGKISNAILIEGNNYMSEFSPNCKYLYVSKPFLFSGVVKQYDLAYSTTASLEATSSIVTPLGMNSRGLKLAPDGKIYITGYSNLHVINSPDEKGNNCGFQLQAIKLLTNSQYMFPYTLPSFLSSSSFNIKTTKSLPIPCKRLVQLEAMVDSNVANIQYEWIFEDGTTSTNKSVLKSFEDDPEKNVFNIKLKVSAEVSYCSNVINQTKEEEIQIIFSPLPVANAGADTIIAEYQHLQLNGSGGLLYRWSPAQYLSNATISNPIATLPVDQTFTLKVTNADGCTDEDQVHIKIYKGPELYVPTGFTPNKDGKNDMLHVLPVGIKLENFSIYNRWGNLIFSTNDYRKGWDGVYKGVLQPEGIYVWMAKGKDFKGQPILRKGTVYLMK
jgi:gliding motility-associated-like protein